MGQVAKSGRQHFSFLNIQNEHFLYNHVMNKLDMTDGKFPFDLSDISTGFKLFLEGRKKTFRVLGRTYYPSPPPLFVLAF